MTTDRDPHTFEPSEYLIGGCAVCGDTVLEKDHPPRANRIAWILECGCEPMYEHCDQCDMRRVVVQEVKTREAWEHKAAELREAGWQVTAP